MARATFVQSNFNSGEWSPLAHGRSDLAKYKNGLSKCQNFMPTQQGGLTRRPGTRIVATTKNAGDVVRLQAFEFSITQAYILEFGNFYIRIFADDGPYYGPIVDLPVYQAGTTYNTNDLARIMGTPYKSLQDSNTGNTPSSNPAWWAPVTIYNINGISSFFIEVITPYSVSELPLLSFTQSADTLYIAHPWKPPMKFQRQSDAIWTLTEISFLDGPYLTVNTTTTTLIPSGLSGLVDVVASSNVGINGGRGFASYDIGRQLRILCNGAWVWGTIYSVSTTTQIKWQIATPTGGMVPAQATAIASISSGSVFGIEILNGGGGYGAVPPPVSLTGGGGSGAIAYANLVDGVVSSITISVTGTGYTSAPTVNIGGPPSQATAIANIVGGEVTSLTVVNAGGGYQSTPNVVITGDGTLANYTAVGVNGSITSYTQNAAGSGYTHATVTIDPPPALTCTPTNFWRLGLWNVSDGYPAVVSFHQNRLCWAGAPNSPNRLDCSNSGDYENMAPTHIDSVVTDSSALSITLNSGLVNSIAWMTSDQWGLLVGTAGGEWSIAPSSTQQALTPTNLNAMLMSNYGSASNIPSLRVGRATLFIQRTGRKVRELMYQFMLQTFQAMDISLISEHLTKGGIKQLALLLSPQQIVWMATKLGALVGMTYDKDQDVCGWHGHILGGFSDAAQTIPPVVESVACIPAPGILRDELWLSVQRYINGSIVRTVEVMSKPWEDGDVLADCNFLDCSSETTGGTTSTSVTGLDWLKGQTVGVLTDGAVHPNCVVASDGTITLNWEATRVQVGLPYTSLAQTLNIEAGGTEGPSQGKIKRIFKTVLRFFQSMGLSLGSDQPGAGSIPLDFRTPQNLMDTADPLFTGDIREAYEGEWGLDGKVSFQTSEPLPVNITMLMAQIDTEEAQ